MEGLFAEACASRRGLARWLLLPKTVIDVARARWHANENLPSAPGHGKEDPHDGALVVRHPLRLARIAKTVGPRPPRRRHARDGHRGDDGGIQRRQRRSPRETSLPRQRAHRGHLARHGKRCPVATRPLQPYAYDDETARNWESVTADHRWITPDYLDALGTTLLSGRRFTEADEGADSPPILIDETLAEIAFADGNPVGRKLRVEPLGIMKRS